MLRRYPTPYAPQRKLQAVLRHHFPSFIRKTFATVSPAHPYMPSWHIDAIAWHLQQCLDGKIRRLIINLPPRSLKSICASVAFPAYVLGKDPRLGIICLSYANDLTAKIARDCRLVLESEWYQGVFPNTRISRHKNTETEVETTAGGFRYGSSVTGSVTGRGADVIIIDDPMKPADGMSETKRSSVNHWFDNTVYSRLDRKDKGVIIIIMQRLNVDDLVGHVLGQADWVVLNLPAIAEVPQRIQIGPDQWFERKPGDLLHPERESQHTLDVLRETLGTYNFSAQYQQNPIPAEGTLIHWKWLRFYSTPPTRSPGDQVVQSWDTASKAEEIHDYSVCTTWLVRDGNYYLLNVFRKRLEYPLLRREIVRLARHYEATTVLIEDKSSGTPLIQELRAEGHLRPIPVKPIEDKVTRMSVQSAKIEAGYVVLPEKAAWLDAFQTEILQFPQGSHDDQVDSVSQFLGWITRPSGGPRVT